MAWTLAKKAVVGVFALLTTLFPLVEMGFFGYEQLQHDAQERDLRQEAFQELSVFQGDIAIALGEAGMADNASERAFYARQIGLADARAGAAHAAWADGNYTLMEEQIGWGRIHLAQEYCPPEDVCLAGEGIVDVDASRWHLAAGSSPWLLWSAIALLLVGLVLWATFIAARVRSDGPVL